MPIFKTATEWQARQLQYQPGGNVRIGRGNPPAWSIKFINYVLEQEGYKGKLELGWTTQRYGGVSGVTFVGMGVIRISAGRQQLASKSTTYVILHELAHLLLPPGVKHAPRFWTKCYDLVEKYGRHAAQFGGENVDLASAQAWALAYKPRTAAQALTERRVAQRRVEAKDGTR